VHATLYSSGPYGRPCGSKSKTWNDSRVLASCHTGVGHTCLTTNTTTHTNPEIVRLCSPPPSRTTPIGDISSDKAGDGSPVGVTGSRLRPSGCTHTASHISPLASAPYKVIEVVRCIVRISGLCLCLGLTSTVGDVGPLVIPQSFNSNHDLKRHNRIHLAEAFPLRALQEDLFIERCIKGSLFI
jgi:hypothetical protein